MLGERGATELKPACESNMMLPLKPNSAAPQIAGNAQQAAEEIVTEVMQRGYIGKVRLVNLAAQIILDSFESPKKRTKHERTET